MDLYKCRLCLEETSRYIEIFQETFPEMIQILSGIKVEPEDGLPTTSCLQCHQEVKSAMLTRYQIINSHKILIEELKFSVEKVLDTYSHSTPKEVKNNNEFAELEYQEILRKSELDEEKVDTSQDCYDAQDNYSSDNEKDIKTEQTDQDSIEANDRSKRTNKEIKFRRKNTNSRKKAEERIEFRKKKSADNTFTVKVQYGIKPEHLEFLKNVRRKDRVACPDCGREMFGMNLKNHLITHNYDPVICDLCGKSSKNAQALQDHINYYHKTTPDRFMCDKCGKGYRVRFMLERHEKKEHGNGEKDYECSICGKKFFEKLHLKNHVNITHKKIKAYKCEHCGKDFGRRTQFVTHQLVHTKQNRYHCQVCGKGFKIKQTMQTHLKGVHGIEEEKTIFCKICQKGFSTPQGLRAHVNSRVHGLEKCEHCSEFITVEYKSVHLKDIHGIDAKAAYS